MAWLLSSIINSILVAVVDLLCSMRKWAKWTLNLHFRTMSAASNGTADAPEHNHDHPVLDPDIWYADNFLPEIITGPDFSSGFKKLLEACQLAQRVYSRQFEVGCKASSPFALLLFLCSSVQTCSL